MKVAQSRCVFCKPLGVKRKGNPKWIANLQVSTAYIANNQICRGYTILLYTKAHETELFKLKRSDLQAYFEDLVKVSKAIDAAYRPHKMNYEVLGNVVPHLHWHIIPRQKTDPIELHWPIWGKDYREVRLSDEEYRKIAQKIRSHL